MTNEDEDRTDSLAGLTLQEAESIRNLYRDRLAALGESQVQLARRAGISQNTVSKAVRHAHMGMQAIDFLRMVYLGFGISADQIAELLQLKPGNTDMRLRNLEAKLARLDDSQLRLVEGVVDKFLEIE